MRVGQSFHFLSFHPPNPDQINSPNPIPNSRTNGAIPLRTDVVEAVAHVGEEAGEVAHEPDGGAHLCGWLGVLGLGGVVDTRMCMYICAYIYISKRLP